MKKMRIFSFFATLLVTAAVLGAPLSASALYDLPADKEISATSVMLVNLGATKEQDVVIFERDADAQILPSALVRVMTTVVALDIITEKGIDMNTATGTYDVDKFNIIAGTGLGTIMGEASKRETWTIKDLLYTAYMDTAADAAVTLAVTLAGSHASFVDRMNQKAEELGCTNTHFANVHAADVAGQYVSARDMYLITREAMDYPEFMNIARQVQYTVKPVSGGPEQRVVTTVNNMIRPTAGDAYYKPMVFGRTGTTDTGRNIVSVAADSGYEYMAVVLNSRLKNEDGTRSNQFVDDTKELYRWAFNGFTYSTVLNKKEPVTQLSVRLAWDTDTVSLVPKDDFSTIISAQMSASSIRKEVTMYEEVVDAPVEKGHVYGKVELFINMDQKIGEMELVAADSVEASQILVTWEAVKSFLTSPWFYGGLILLAVLLIGYIVLNVVHNRRRKRRKMKRVKKYK